MIDIILLAEQYSTEYTLASLMKKSDNYRVHLFVRPKLYNQYKSEIQWALENIRELYVYQTPFDEKTDPNKMAMVLNQFKEHSSKKFCVCSYNVFKCPLCRTFLYMTLDDYKYYNPMPYKFCCSTKYLRPFNCIDLVQYT